MNCRIFSQNPHPQGKSNHHHCLQFCNTGPFIPGTDVLGSVCVVEREQRKPHHTQPLELKCRCSAAHAASHQLTAHHACTASKLDLSIKPLAWGYEACSPTWLCPHVCYLQAAENQSRGSTEKPELSDIPSLSLEKVRILSFACFSFLPKIRHFWFLPSKTIEIISFRIHLNHKMMCVRVCHEQQIRLKELMIFVLPWYHFCCWLDITWSSYYLWR